MPNNKQEIGRIMVEQIVKILDDKKGTDIVVLDMRKSNLPLDYFVIATGRSSVHLNSLYEAVMNEMADVGVKPLHHIVDSTATWGVIDYFDVVVHIFQEQERKFYDLEDLWFDNQRLEGEKLNDI